MGRHIHNPDAGKPTVDVLNNRNGWVSSYNDTVKVEGEPTVDTTSTRGQWMTSYSNDKSEVGKDPTVDATKTRDFLLQRQKRSRQRSNCGHNQYPWPVGDFLLQ